MLKDNFPVIHKALADIYIAVEDTSNPSDIHDSRPRNISKDIETAYVNLCTVLDKHFNLAEGSCISGIRPIIRKAIGISGTHIGYADEELTLAQMVTRASPTGWGVQYQSDIKYRR